MKKRSLFLFAAALGAALLAACSGGSETPDTISARALDSGRAASGKVVIQPGVISVAVHDDAVMTAAEANYAGRFIATSSGKRSCAGIARWHWPKGERFILKVTGVKPGSCEIAIRDTKAHTAWLRVTVQT